MQVKLEVTFDIPVDAEIKDVDEWVKFQLGKTCLLPGSNKMASVFLEEMNFTKISVSEV